MIPESAHRALQEAAVDPRPVSGWTHKFYRYPARFSPQFAASAIANFSKPGDLVGDPYMGGGTVVVEAIAAGRDVVGNDLNSLATFVARVKTRILRDDERTAVAAWALDDVPELSYRTPREKILVHIDAEKIRNLSLLRARFIKKLIAAALASIAALPTNGAREFARCALLRVAQWALDGRRRQTTLEEFRSRLASTALEMLDDASLLADRVRLNGARATLLNLDATKLHTASVFRAGGRQLDLVVTSPPYPGVHVLYHRWQVDGRKESPAPYWISGSNDGKGSAYYNFGDNRRGQSRTYFEQSLRTLRGIRRIVRDGGLMVQLIAFNRPEDQLPMYLDNLRHAGFDEVSNSCRGRIWREVPNRKWHATMRGTTHSANEVVLVHRAV